MVSSTLALVAAACFLSPFIVTSEQLLDLLFNGNYEFIDLTHPFNNETIYWPGVARFKFIKETRDVEVSASHWYASNEFESGEHGGTHIDAPYHFYQPGKYVGDLPMEKLIVQLIVADVSSKVDGNCAFVLHKNDLGDILNETFDKPSVIVFKFGWSQYFNDPDKYLGTDVANMKFPGISAEVAEWIASSKNIVGVGVDTASIDPEPNDHYPAHSILASAGLYNMENVNLYKPIPGKNCIALVLPMKIGHGTGAPLRLVAVCPKEG